MACICHDLITLDARFIKAERAYRARSALEGKEPYSVEWAEGREVDRLSDERFDLEEAATESCCLRVRDIRRDRDDE